MNIITPVNLSHNPYKHPSFNAKLNESLIKKGVIDLRYAIKTSVDEKIFSKQELEMLNLTNIDPGLKSITWRGTSILPHTLYRGIATIKPPLDGEELIRSNFINNVCAMKKGDLFSFNNGACHELLTFTSYDYKEAARFCDLANVLKSINKRALFEIEMPRNSHMFVYPKGDQGLVCLPVNNIYELIENPQIIKTKVITFGNQINDSEFILIKLKLKQENL